MNLTTIILSLTALVLILYDIAAALIWGQRATISVTLYSLSKQYPVIPFLIGFVLGHVIWVQ